jgi:hypothetical protein
MHSEFVTTASSSKMSFGETIPGCWREPVQLDHSLEDRKISSVIFSNICRDRTTTHIDGICRKLFPEISHNLSLFSFLESAAPQDFLTITEDVFRA